MLAGALAVGVGKTSDGPVRDTAVNPGAVAVGAWDGSGRRGGLGLAGPPGMQAPPASPGLPRHTWPWHVAGGAAWSLARVRADPPPGALGAFALASGVAAGMASGLGAAVLDRTRPSRAPPQARTFALLLVPVVALLGLQVVAAGVPQATRAWLLAQQLVPPLGRDPRE